MNVRSLKSAIAAFLLLANLCFILLISLNLRNKYYYDSETIQNAYSAIEQGGFGVARGILERKQRSFSVYKGDCDILSCNDIIALYGTLAAHYNIGDDVSVVCEAGEYTFFRDGSFEYITNSGVKLPESTAQTVDVTAQRKVYKMLKAAIEEFLKMEELEKCASNKKSNVDVDIYIEKISYDPETKAYIVNACQTFDGDSVSQNGVEFVAYDDIIVRASGTFSFVYPTEKIFADSLDTINIILCEKNYFEGREPQELVLSEIVYFYSVYDSADGSRYFIPMCCVLYDRADIFGIYNLVSGKRE
ncbi:MAG: hypothetical protein J6D11_06530 [Clostridia bacterium]|nr:hypothetical protein [Clostridia bacterium]